MPLPDASPASPGRRARLIDAAEQLGLALAAGQVDQLLAYLDLLQRWNTTYNLTAIRDPEQALTHHVFDCLALIRPLQKHLGPIEAPRLLDVGSGGGLPGAVIAILCPAVDVTCVDTVGKKAAFVRQVAGHLRLRNLHAEHARVEALRAAPFDVITARAFASLADFVALTRAHRARDGVWLAMKGKDPADERAQLPADVRVFHVEQLVVPGLEAERCLVWMRLVPSL